MRDYAWLQNQLELLLKKYFPDMPITNPIEIHFGREAKFRFGSIRLEGRKKISNFKIQIPNLRALIKQESDKGDIPQKSIITITSMFSKLDIPEDVVLYTISHELCHYAHGFSSTNKRMFRHPHHGGVVNKELEKRGAGHLVKAYKLWLKQYRQSILEGRTRLF